MSKTHVLQLVFLFLSGISVGQITQEIDRQRLTNVNKWVTLVYKTGQIEDGQEKYNLVFTDINYKDSLVMPVNVGIPACARLNSILFTNDSVGFITLTGGCYMYNNRLYRTTNKGKQWERVDLGKESYNSSQLSGENFQMFDEQRGIIIWQIEEDHLTYSITTDSGINWSFQKQKLPFESISHNAAIEVIYFTQNGEVTLITRYRQQNGTDKTAVLQSIDFGKSFNLLK
ncbi:MAG: hypothetical protein QE487_16975 [Fluviicola sp.]|nr:hypothetical protein [Fluviicola sp.]